MSIGELYTIIQNTSKEEGISMPDVNIKTIDKEFVVLNYYNENNNNINIFIRIGEE